jgi:D-alanine-D-alanine ligase
VSDLITIVFGGPSPEHDISILTGLQCERVLRGSGAQVQCLYWAHGGDWWQVPENSEARDYVDGRPDGSTRVEIKLDSEPGFRVKRGLRVGGLEVGTVLNCFHGGVGEGGGVQSLFELLGLRATGSSPYAAALGMDKFAFGCVMQSAGLPTLPRVLVDADGSPPAFAGPYIMKPRYGGSSIGIEVVADFETAQVLARSNRHFAAGAVLEPYRDDLADYNIAFRTHPELTTSLLERPTREDAGADVIYSYAEKYLQGSGLASAPRELPADVPESLTLAIRGAAEKVARVTGLTGIVRIDFLSDGADEFFVNEVNSIPGAMALYLWPKDVAASTLLSDMVAEAAQGARPPLTSSDGSALRAAGGIAGKLQGLSRG